ncbi:MAG TPA: LuxR C-terminal-related transcriptional regulator [Chloroflexia bacterium]|jgi:DNA-binding CsgD family transcriptional regulator
MSVSLTAINTPGLSSQHAHTFDIWCNVSYLAYTVTAALAKQGLTYDISSPTKIIMDNPHGFALRVLETLDRKDLCLIAVTFNLCVEYWEDLWNLHPNVLLVNPKHEHDFASAIRRVLVGDEYCLTPKGASTLNSTERLILQYLARGCSNQEIASRINMQEKSVRNTLSAMYRKLGVKKREQAIMYYWGLWHDAVNIPNP